jgi:hypothetical protein
LIVWVFCSHLLGCSEVFQQSNEESVSVQIFDENSESFLKSEFAGKWFSGTATESLRWQRDGLMYSEGFESLFFELPGQNLLVLAGLREKPRELFVRQYKIDHLPRLGGDYVSRVTGTVGGFSPTSLSEHGEATFFAFSQTGPSALNSEFDEISDRLAVGQNLLSIENDVDFYLPRGPVDLFLIERIVKDNNSQIFELGRWHHQEVNYVGGVSSPNEEWELDQFVNIDICENDPGTLTFVWPFLDRRFLRPVSGELRLQYGAEVFGHNIQFLNDRLTQVRVIDQNTARFRSPNQFMLDNATAYSVSSQATRATSQGFDFLDFEDVQDQSLICESEFSTPETAEAFVWVTGTTLTWDWTALTEGRPVLLYEEPVSTINPFAERKPDLAVWTFSRNGSLDLNPVLDFEPMSVAVPIHEPDLGLLESRKVVTAANRSLAEESGSVYWVFRDLLR